MTARERAPQTNPATKTSDARILHRHIFDDLRLSLEVHRV